jgi:RNA polymerase sigma-70 factor (sigma-E family)
VSDHDASYVEFVTAHQARLRRIAYAVCRDDSRAEDVLQEAFVKLYLSWSKVRLQGVEEAYARRIIVNADIDDRRRPWRRHRTAASDEHLARVAAPEPLSVEDRSELLEAVRALPAMQRRTVVLRHLVGLTVEETAAELGIGEGTVKSHTSRGLATLRDSLATSTAPTC